jgi:hypothetical protein
MAVPMVNIPNITKQIHRQDKISKTEMATMAVVVDDFITAPVRIRVLS